MYYNESRYEVSVHHRLQRLTQIGNKQSTKDKLQHRLLRLTQKHNEAQSGDM